MGVRPYNSGWSVFLSDVRRTVIEVSSVNPFPLSQNMANATITDSKGKQHTISPLDFSPEEWEKIASGTKIELTICEAVKRDRVL